MKERRPLPSQLALWAIFNLDCETGFLTWKYRPAHDSRWNGRFSGQRAGNYGARGYRTVSIDGVAYFEHRLIWKMLYCEDPQDIDHIDGKTSNNSWRNLRNATTSQNLANRKRKIGKRLPKGIDMTPAGKFRATVSFNRTVHRLGHFETIEQAMVAYSAKAKELHGEFTRID